MDHLMVFREAAFPLPGGGASLSLSLDEGTVHVLLGGPESGLEELGRILGGEMQPTGGEMLFCGRPAAFASPADALKKGCARSPGIVGPLSVRDHLRLLFPEGAQRNGADALKEAFLPGADMDAPARSLSPEDRLGLEMMLSALRGDRLLALEDPMRDIPPALFDRAAQMMARRAAMGCCVAILTRRPRHARLGQRATVLKGGAVVHDGPAGDVTVGTLEDLMGVGSRSLRESLREAIPGGVVLEVRGLSSRRRRGETDIRSVSFEVREGEILGLCAMKGAGGERLMRILAGLERPASGRIRLKGEAVRTHSFAALHTGVRFIPAPADLRAQALSGLTVKDMLAMQCARFSSLFVGGMLRPGRLDAYTRFILKEYPIAPDGDAPLSSLSDSEMRMLQEAPELDRTGNVLLLCHPAEPLTASACRFLWQCLEDEKLRHTGMVYLTDQVDEAMAVCDRILVMHGGAVTLECDPLNASRKQIALAMSAASPRP